MILLQNAEVKCFPLTLVSISWFWWDCPGTLGVSGHSGQCFGGTNAAFALLASFCTMVELIVSILKSELLSFWTWRRAACQTTYLPFLTLSFSVIKDICKLFATLIPANFASVKWEWQRMRVCSFIVLPRHGCGSNIFWYWKESVIIIGTACSLSFKVLIFTFWEKCNKENIKRKITCKITCQCDFSICQHATKLCQPSQEPVVWLSFCHWVQKVTFMWSTSTWRDTEDCAWTIKWGTGCPGSVVPALCIPHGGNFHTRADEMGISMGFPFSAASSSSSALLVLPELTTKWVFWWSSVLVVFLLSHLAPAPKKLSVGLSN